MGKSPHNLKTYSLEEMLQDISNTLPSEKKTGANQYLDKWGDLMERLLKSITELEAPLSAAAQILQAVQRGAWGMMYSRAKTKNLPRCEKLMAVWDKHKSKTKTRFGIELADGEDIDEILNRYIVRKGILFTMKGVPQTVFWHPWKDFKPCEPLRVHKTQHSIVGWRKKLNTTLTGSSE